MALKIVDEYGLTPRQRAAADLFVVGRRPVDVATTVKVAPSTLSKWQNEPRFKAYISEQQKKRLGFLAEEAISTLSAAMHDGNVWARIQSARAILDMTARSRGEDKSVTVSFSMPEPVEPTEN